jgi:hypothetical protein
VIVCTKVVSKWTGLQASKIYGTESFGSGLKKSSAFFAYRGNRFTGFGGDGDEIWVADDFKKTNSWPWIIPSRPNIFAKR